MVAPGFPRGGAPALGWGGGGPTYDFAQLSQKLHEIERIWTIFGQISLLGDLSMKKKLLLSTVFTTGFQMLKFQVTTSLKGEEGI